VHKVTCPVCHLVFEVEDIHRPIKCPYCGALLELSPPDWEPRVLLLPRDMMGDTR